MMDNGSCASLTIHRVAKGGYLIMSQGYDRGMMSEMLFACSEIQDALNFIRKHIVPVLPQQGSK